MLSLFSSRSYLLKFWRKDSPFARPFQLVTPHFSFLLTGAGNRELSRLFLVVNHNQITNQKTLDMKLKIFTMSIATAMIISSLSSCNKDDSLTVQTPGGNSAGNSSSGSLTLYQTTNRWEARSDGVFVNVFSNIIPAGKPDRSVNVYVILSDADLLINSAIPFMGGQLSATNTQTDVAIVFRGNLQNSPNLTIKIVIQ